MLKLADLCPGTPVDDDGAPLPGYMRRCACGLAYDPARGPHTLRGLRLPPDIYARILAREGVAYEVDERRESAGAVAQVVRLVATKRRKQ